MIGNCETFDRLFTIDKKKSVRSGWKVNETGLFGSFLQKISGSMQRE